jgi:UDP-N-acetylglucosamine--N-acetylmuramyl-(pentapeptide) pyrophosphoryl-undecaprenol N-acetylglucosamine transferase
MPIRVLISGGGTGGHIFPAIAIANEIKSRHADAEILFVGALGRMEMEKVPLAGYKIIGLPIAGLQRKLSLSNFILPFKLLKSILMACKIIKDFKPDIAIGVGGYASAALIYAASTYKVPILIQEQNSYAGLTNKWLSSKASKICVAYPNMEKYFPGDKIVETGNPVRSEIYSAISMDKRTAKKDLGFNEDEALVLVIGGSLGARTINMAVQEIIAKLSENKIQILWQTGKNYIADTKGLEGVKASVFIQDMATSYAAADIVVSRAGAISVSELSLLNKASILVPSPNVAEDHQTKNAKALSSKQAAILLSDTEARDKLFETIQTLLNDVAKQDELKSNLKAFAKPNALSDIVNEIEKLLL